MLIPPLQVVTACLQYLTCGSYGPQSRVLTSQSIDCHSDSYKGGLALVSLLLILEAVLCLLAGRILLRRGTHKPPQADRLSILVEVRPCLATPLQCVLTKLCCGVLVVLHPELTLLGSSNSLPFLPSFSTFLPSFVVRTCCCWRSASSTPSSQPAPSPRRTSPRAPSPSPLPC